MDHDHHGPPSEAEGSDRPSGRRKFLRQAGMTAAAAAALVGIGDVVGLTPASGATMRSAGATMRSGWALTGTQVRPEISDAPHNTQVMSCTCTPSQCPETCHPDGVWCHYCVWVSGGYCSPTGYYCLQGCYTTSLINECS